MVCSGGHSKLVALVLKLPEHYLWITGANLSFRNSDAQEAWPSVYRLPSYQTCVWLHSWCWRVSQGLGQMVTTIAQLKHQLLYKSWKAFSLLSFVCCCGASSGNWALLGPKSAHCVCCTWQLNWAWYVSVMRYTMLNSAVMWSKHVQTGTGPWASAILWVAEPGVKHKLQQTCLSMYPLDYA